MPWKETCAMQERMKFVLSVLEEADSFSALCRRFGITRRTGYKWVERFEAEGPKGLENRSRAPRHPARKVTPEVEGWVLELRRAHPKKGPKKLGELLVQAHPEQNSWPSISTLGAVLGRYGLTVPRKRRRRVEPSGESLSVADGPNALWTVDFKGWFRARNGERCEPLTVMDAYSRYLFCVVLLPTTAESFVQPILEALFHRYGLPRRIRSDNGPPFASRALAGLSKLSLGWLRLGIVHERIDTGKPQQNGSHERMHRTLKFEGLDPRPATARSAQRQLERWRKDYNEARPHEALGQRVPAVLYEPSPCALPQRLLEANYPSTWLVRKVDKSGKAYWKHQGFFVSEVLAGQRLGLEALGEGNFRLWCFHLEIGTLHTKGRLRFVRTPAKQKKASPPPVPPQGGGDSLANARDEKRLEDTETMEANPNRLGSPTATQVQTPEPGGSQPSLPTGVDREKVYTMSSV